jgi:hypothetical protein
MPQSETVKSVDQEALQTEANLTAALRELEDDLLEAGINKVRSDVIGFAKGDSDPFNTGLTIELGSGIASTAMIGLTFFYEDNREKTIKIECWEDEGGDQLSGPATKETFKRRIKEKLGIGEVEGRQDVPNALDDLLGEFADQDVAEQHETVSPEVIEKAQALLRDTAQKIKDRGVTLNDERMERILVAMIGGTPFEDAKVEVRKSNLTGSLSFGDNTVFDNLETVFGEYGSDNAYNVWFEKEKDQWVIACKKIPEGGHFR